MKTFLILFCNLIALLLYPVRTCFGLLRKRPAARYVRLCLNATLTDLPAPKRGLLPALLARVQRKHGADLRQVQRLLDRIAGDPEVDGLLLQVGHFHAGWSVVGGLRQALLQLRGKGKRVVLYLMQGGDDKALYLASAVDQVALSPAASLTCSGVSYQGLYLQDLLNRVGLRVQVNAQGTYKTAAEALLRSEMSAAQREQLEALLIARQELLSTALAPRLADGHTVAQLLEEVSLSPERAREVGLAQYLCYEDGLSALLGQSALGERWLTEAAKYRRRPRLWRPLSEPPYLAILPLVGAIRERGGGTQAAVALEPTVAAIRELRRNKRVAGVLLYVNSPGGSALVSDLIHHEIEQLAAEKPLVAYFADVAASGGYYVAAPAHRIVAAPEAITGSIGVVSVKVVAAGLMEKLGVVSQVVRTGPHADMMSLARPMDEAEEAILDRESRRIYARFLEVVATGRRMAVDGVVPLAGGRVWSAQDALTHGLVDQLGTLSDAIAELQQVVEPQPKRPLRTRVYASRGRHPWAPVAPHPSEPPADGLLTQVRSELENLTWLAGSAEGHLYYWVGGQRDCSS